MIAEKDGEYGMRSLKKILVSSCLALALVAGGALLTTFGYYDPPHKYYWYTQRHDITFGNHSADIWIDVKPTKTSRIMMWDKNWYEVWATNTSGDKWYQCGSNVYYFTIFLDSDKSAYVAW